MGKYQKFWKRCALFNVYEVDVNKVFIIIQTNNNNYTLKDVLSILWINSLILNG